MQKNEIDPYEKQEWIKDPNVRAKVIKLLGKKKVNFVTLDKAMISQV